MIKKLATAVAAAAAVSTMAAPAASAGQLCETSGAWHVCMETHADGLWHARGWGPSAAITSLWKNTTLQQWVWTPLGGGNVTTAGASGSTAACVGASATSGYYVCVSRLA